MRPVRRKSRAIVSVPDGTGGMARVHDRRFEAGNWPIRFTVPEGDEAETWLRYLSRECHRRNWNTGGLAQLDARENSGTITINADGPAGRQIAVVWDRNRCGPLEIRAHSSGP